ncbi:MAG: cytochrome b N-terminal domain-containing protein [Gemmatimonadota bacterium]|nr:cytochrome b N-terminal domain-containing protein [Gemmatimonadota bacterium]
MTRTLVRRTLDRLDSGANRLYGWRFNPLYQSGTLVVVALAVMLVTGLYLLLFYRIGAPFESVGRITDQVWGGRWIRSAHRYAADLAVAAAAVHALRMFAQGRSWGPRTLAWVSGLVLVFLLYVCGWTGYVMIWDTQALLLAAEGARLLDALPIFSAPIARAFSGEAPPPSAFFFLNLFLHIAVPIGMIGALWLHVSRVARPVLLPPRGLLWSTVGVLVAVSVLWPITMDPPADLLALPGETTLDLFYGFWLPLARRVPAGWVWASALAGGAALILVPFLTRPPADRRPLPSVVDARQCTGCEQCYVDCPYDAIRMVPRDDGRGYLLASVDPALCVSCGICAGSCAPMGVGPPDRNGRDQLEAVRAFIDRDMKTVDGAMPQVVVVACAQSAFGRGAPGGGRGPGGLEPAVPRFDVSCAGNLHSSVVEFLTRAGAAGVLVSACPPRDCWNREGPIWLRERLFNDREAELKERVDKRRVRTVHAGGAEPRAANAALGAFRADLDALDAPAPETAIEMNLECELTGPEALR